MHPRQDRRRGSDGIRYCIRYTDPLPSGYQPAVVSADRILLRRRKDAKIAAAADLVLGSGAPASLQAKARRLGVSHEAVRQAMRAAGLPTDLATRNARIREMADRGVSWPVIARAFGLSPSAVRHVCRELPPRPSGPKRRGRTEGRPGG